MRLPAILKPGGLQLDKRWLPFADIATADMPLSRFVRLSLFQVSVGIMTTLFFGTLNRVMIVEMGVSASLVGIFIGLPMLAAPFRALMGFRSDTHRSVFGVRRVPFILLGTGIQWAGLALMPWALLVLSQPAREAARPVGALASGLCFLLMGLGTHMTQTAGLALATDLAPPDKRPRVVALMYLTLLIGVVVSAFAFGIALRDFSPMRLIQVIHTCALITLYLNIVASWRMEPQGASLMPYAKGEKRPAFRDAWHAFAQGGPVVRLVVATAVGFFAFNLQDVLLEPYGAEILGLTVSQTTHLTGLMAIGAVLSFVFSARLLERGLDPVRVAAVGALVGITGFLLVLLSSGLDAALLLRGGTVVIGFGEAMFGVGTLTYAMGLRGTESHGMALGAWGAAFATGEGLALALSGTLRDGVSAWMAGGQHFALLASPNVVPYNAVYLLEIVSLVVLLALLGPLAHERAVDPDRAAGPFGLAELPG